MKKIYIFLFLMLLVMTSIAFSQIPKIINYQGLFNFKELFKLLDEFFRKHGYKKVVLGEMFNVCRSFVKN